MTPERWQQVKEVLASVLEVEPDQRSSFLDRSCLDDVSLRSEVEILLEHEERSDSAFLSHAALASAAATLVDADNPWIGRRVGPYRVVELLGVGGMGEVFRAYRADDEYRKEVALKMVGAGEVSGFALSRFRNERQILASLDHANIARLLDGGTAEGGALYFVMELIDGQPITQYCDRHGLSIAQRLGLFSQVCDAVQYAHQRLIVHRDIKPANILITADGTPKLLDFGIAKILEANSTLNLVETGVDTSPDATLPALRILTPRYASPEQIQGGPMTTASDVYSLGVVLYELLTGQSPYQTATGTPQEIAQAACETEPKKPSTIVARTGAARQKLSGDLDNIVLMALRKEPFRRYASVEQLKEDIRRHLDDLPVLAREDTIRYRTTKFVRRNKVVVAACFAVTLALTIGLLTTMHEARIARQQRARAERRFNDVRKLANSLIFELHDSIRDLPGATQARTLLVARALEYLDSLSQEASGDLALQQELAAAYDRLGDVLGYNGAANLGDSQGALKSYKKALAIREAAADANPDNLQIQSDLLSDYFRLSFVLQDAGDSASALSDLSKALPVAERFVAMRGDPGSQDLYAGFYWSRGNILKIAGDYPHALEDFRKSASIREPAAASAGATPVLRAHLASDYIGVGWMLDRTGNSREGVESLKKGVGILEALSAADPSSATLREYLAEAYQETAAVLTNMADVGHAMDYDQKAYRIFADLHSADTKNSLAANNFGCAEQAVGRDFMLKGDMPQAMEHIRNAIAIFEQAEPRNQYVVAGEATSYAAMGAIYDALSTKDRRASAKVQHLREAAAWYRKSISRWEQQPDHGASNPLGGQETKEQVRQMLAKCEAALAHLPES